MEPNKEIVLTQEVVTAELRRLFKALQKSFANPDNLGEGTVKAYEVIENLATMIEESPDMIRTVLTEKNLIGLKTLQAKQAAGNVSILDFFQAFPDIGNAVKQSFNPFK
ncbi:hypothetical protein [Spirosoma linguale]|uniref:Uncharacterized protein n=1 Tax=Spirosoma linguale (strain ATCC 33905 / DSM 74 / LMG 10896 / Claus 1) TaxID=504472 RepID=D2QGE0_SPILD|nr:hypothetical protein Slin_0684 [Spirosoma linguale DSM 74]